MEKFCLKWNDFQTNVSKTFSTLRKEQDFFDITLLSDDGEAVSAHKVVLSASSEFFKSVLRKADHSKPMIYLSDVKPKVLSNILDYIYEGEVGVHQEDLANFLEVAEQLKINGLTGGQDDDKNNPYKIDLESSVHQKNIQTLHCDQIQGSLSIQGSQVAICLFLFPSDSN